ERMWTEHGVSLSRAELERMAGSLTRRLERRRVGEEELLRIAVDGQVESRVEEAERSRTDEELRVLMAPLLRSLSPQDRLLLKLHYWDGLSMAAISPLLGRPQRELYSVRDKCLKKIRRNLEEAGLGPERIRALLGCSRLELAPGDL
ncbi:MAG: RNA polymerase sigma factor, partial [Thermoanaerobaculia bacterium]